MLVLICGHGAEDCGAVGNGYQEAERVRVLAQKIKEFGGDDVLLCDMNRNYYKDNGISNMTLSKDCKILELHMDSSSNATAKGAHVIIYGGYKADAYDEKLAKFISGIFEGRSNTIVGRTDLANPNRAAKKGYNYRLLECGFISNADDVQKFNSRMDEIAKGILGCFDINVKEVNVEKPVEVKPTPTHAKKSDNVYEWQKAAIADGFVFPKYGADGKWGAECESIAKKAICKQRDDYRYRNLTKIVQRVCGTKVDGKFGKNTKAAVIAFQRKHGLVADGCVGINTWKKIIGV